MGPRELPYESGFLDWLRVRLERSTNKVADRGHCLHTSAPACDHKSYQRFLLFAAFRIHFFQMRDQMVSKTHRISQGLHHQRVLLQARNPIQIRHRPQADNKAIELEHMLVMTESMGDDNFLFRQIDMLNPAREKLDFSKQLAHWVHNCRQIHLASRDLMQHRCEREEIIAIDKPDRNAVASQPSLQLHGDGDTKKQPPNRIISLVNLFHKRFRGDYFLRLGDATELRGKRYQKWITAGVSCDRGS